MSTIAVFGVLAGGGAYAAGGGAGPQRPKGDGGATGPASFAANCSAGLAAGDVLVRVGSVCIDKYEASIWTAKTGRSQIPGPIPCKDDGSDCKGKIFARSVAGVKPARNITWFQAQQALANSGKLLPSNGEWQMAVAGTPDGGPCNVDLSVRVNTGSASAPLPTE